jgi:branched-chain amino acid aminotransferase
MSKASNPHLPGTDLNVWLDGRIVHMNDARISVFDHAVLYGDGVFEGIRAYSGKVFQMEAHMRRIYEGARAICLTIPIDRQAFEQAIYETLKANNLKDAYIRAVVTRGAGYLGLHPSKTANPSVFIITCGLALYPKELYEKGMAIVTASTIRNHPHALSAQVKSLNYLNNIMAQIEATQAGAVEAVMLNHQGYVSECTGDNIFAVRRGELLTPPASAGILEGITRDVVIELARRRQIPVHEKDMTRHDLYVADECFLTGTGAEIMPITAIDQRPIGCGRIGVMTRQLLEDFWACTRGQIDVQV